MKTIVKKWMMVLMGMMLLNSCSKDNRIIEKPVFLASNTTSIEVSKVTLTDSTTVLDIFARYQPKYWIRIAGSSYLTDDKGNTYPIQSGVGIELDKEFWMPESGEAEFQLVFPRLRNGAQYFDFSEGAEVEGGFNIWGVQLKSDVLPELDLPKELMAQEVDKEASLEIPELTYGEAVVKGKILDFRPGMPETVKILATSPLMGYDGESVVKVAPDGSFTHTMNVLGTSMAYLSYNDDAGQTWIFVAPGQTSEVYLNIREEARRKSKFHSDSASYGKRFYYRGPLENVVREMEDALNLEYGAEQGNYDFEKKPEVLLEEYKKHWTDGTEKFRRIIAESSLGKSAKTYMDRFFTLRLLSYLQDAPLSLASNYAYTQKIEMREAYQAFYEKLAKVYPADYVNKELYAVLNEPLSLLDGEYGNFVQRSEMIQEQCDMGNGLFAQMASTSKYYRAIKDFSPLTDAQKEEMKSLPEAVQQYLNTANDELLKRIEANKKKNGFRVNEAGEVANEDLFASIISKFQGKVLLVDFWATWCGPCRMANEAMVPMKEELKDKDIVYVYITGETSPKNTWENMIPDIHGEHFRVTDAQWSYLRNSMGIEGVPTYFVIDREGNIQYKSVGFPGVSKMKEELNKALEK